MDVLSSIGAAGNAALDNLGGPDAAGLPPVPQIAAGASNAWNGAAAPAASDTALAPAIAFAPSPTLSAELADVRELAPDIRYAPSPAPHSSGFDRSA